MILDSSIIEFLRQLTVNNNKPWFHENKAMYNDARASFEKFTDYIIDKISEFDKEISGLKSKDCLFRIYKDVRFSKDKTSYKTNFGAYIAKQGKKSGFAGYYIHIEPDNSFIGGGVYMPQSEKLKKIRKEIYNKPQAFINIINNPSFIKTYKLVDDKLKTAPRDFDKNWEHIDLLKYKSYAVIKKYSDKDILNKNYVENIIDDFKTLKPLNDFINKALSKTD
ncbi:MAG: DUF2461 domain-containing protein [Marinilabiliales bacterium]